MECAGFKGVRHEISDSVRIFILRLLNAELHTLIKAFTQELSISMGEAVDLLIAPAIAANEGLDYIGAQVGQHPCAKKFCDKIPQFNNLDIG